MARTCTICSHEDRSAIDHALIRRTAYRDIARQHEVSKDALSRHVKDHLPQELTRAERARQAEEADQLLNEVRTLQVYTARLMNQAEAAGPDFWGILLRAVREQRGNIELRLKAKEWDELEGRIEELENERGGAS